MPRKDQGWITFQTSEAERQLLEEVCQHSQRSKTEVLRELLRSLQQATPPTAIPTAAPDAPSDRSASLRRPLRVSSRNVLQGRVKRIVTGSVNSEVTLEIMHTVELTSIITKTSVEDLGLAEGQEAYAVIKSSDIVIAME